MLFNRLENSIKDLIDTAQGRCRADLIIKNATLINVHTLELLNDICILVKHGRIAYVGEYIDRDAYDIIDLDHKLIAPGFMDAHCHIESSLLTPINYAKAVIKYGTTAVFADPHEIANVFGIEGFKLFFEEAKLASIRIFLEIPSTVPISEGSIRIDAEQVKELLEYSNILGEVMNYDSLLASDNNTINKITYALRNNAIIDGHAPMLNIKDLCSYISAGISSCHENDYAQDLLNKLRLGMYVMVREGSLSKNIHLLRDIKLADRHTLFASDDLLPTDIVKRGHINYNIKRAVEEGIEPLKAIQMATLNIAERFNLSLDLGSISPARLADMVVLDDLERFECNMVFVNGRLMKEVATFNYPDYVKNSVNVKRKIKREDISIDVNGVYHIIGVKDSLITDHIIQEVDNRTEKVVVVERHKASGDIGIGFTKGFELRYGAIASSISHDSHNLIAVGVNDDDIVLALNKVIDMQGGFAVVKDKVLAKLELPIGGLVSQSDAETVAQQLSNILDIIKKELKCKHSSPLVALTFLALPVIPHLRITDKGLFDVDQHKIIELQKK